ncbi:MULTISPECIES: site-specific integrase [Bacillus cereus group]|uniref:site-specific integrase n=1 Tax=Bacillus cereus group TaxID=86661 RepID=UPI000AE7BB04|nr:MULTISPECIES: site-specific integrase [Bacillus cereus group]MDG1621893.1 site-specific integrase [Bacillus mobilis]MDX5838015.1 site-specific integrase [Bacillus cereus group sp. BfR-BA-01700]
MSGTVSKNKDTGKWDFVFAIKDPMTGKRKQIRRRGFATKREANEEMTLLKAEYLNDDFLKLSHMSYDSFMEQWFKERQNQLQKSTFRANYTHYLNIIKPRLGHLRIQDITTMHLQHYINTLIEENRYSKGTINLTFSFIRTSLKRAKVLKLIKNNPATDVVLPRITKTEMEVWTLDQVNYFLSGSKTMKNATRFRISFSIAIFTGMRQGEIWGPRWKDINFENNRIFIRQTLSERGELKYGAKNKTSIRTIHIPMILIEELKTHRKFVEYEKEKAGDKYTDLDLALPSKYGKPLDSRSIRRSFYNVTEKLGLPRIRVHDLRHTHATLLIQQNVNVKLVEESMVK